MKSCKETGLHYSNSFPHNSKRKTVTVTEIPLVANDYISNSKTLKSVSVRASVTIINSQTIKVCICNPENRQITDYRLPVINADLVTDFPNGLLGFRQGSGNNYELHVCNRQLITKLIMPSLYL